MSDGERTNDYVTVTVLASETLLRPDGRVAILLVTKEQGPIAFEVNQHAIDTLRLVLGNAETLLRRSEGQSRPN
jgi:hypothetical protein